MKDGKEKTLYAAAAQLLKPTWSPDGRNLFMNFRDATTRWEGQIGEIDVRSGKFHRVTNDLNNYSGRSLAVTKDGKQLVTIQGFPDIGLYVMQATPKLTSRPQPIDTRSEVNVGWLKDGRLLLSDFQGHVATLNADGSSRNVIFESTSPIVAMSVCPVGKSVLL